jgi:hypothetical protein
MSPVRAPFGQIRTYATDNYVDGRSELFAWLSENRVEFAEHQSESSWAAWALALNRGGVSVKGGRPVTGRTLRQTWWRVRRHFGMPIREPILGAEKAKVQKRRSPRRATVRAPEPPLRPGEVAPGVRLANPPTKVVDASEDDFLNKLKGLQGWTET